MTSINAISPPPSATRGEVGRGVRSIVATARKLRRSSTDVERKLWHRIRDKQVEGFRFRRQRPIGKYIVDFICLNAKLIVELDGGQHADAIEYDEKRSTFLESLGYRVLRFWNNDVIENMDGVLECLREDLLCTHANPSPTLPLAVEGANRACVIASGTSNVHSPAARGNDRKGHAGPVIGVCEQQERSQGSAKEKK